MVSVFSRQGVASVGVMGGGSYTRSSITPAAILTQGVMYDAIPEP